MLQGIKSFFGFGRVEESKSSLNQITTINEFNIQSNQLIIPKKNLQIIQQYTLKSEVIGEGGFSKVVIGVQKCTGIQRAIKIINKKLINNEDSNRMYKEIEILKKLDHPNIVKVVDFFDDRDQMYIVTELCTGGQLFEQLVRKERFSEKMAAIIIYQILGALNYCHKQGIIHRDIKPENIMHFHPQDETLKIIDFGSSIEYNKKKLTGKTGTPYYVAPEVLKGEYDQKCDIWSVGVLLFTILSGVHPFNGASQQIVLEKVRKGKYDFNNEEWKSISKEAKNYIKKMMELNVTKRYTSDQALYDVWLHQNIESLDNQVEMKNTLKSLHEFRLDNQLQDAIYTFMVNFLTSSQEKNEILSIFNQLDTNHDGQLSKEELIMGYTKHYGLQNAQEVVDKIMNDVDKNKNELLDYSEWVMATIDKKQTLSESNLKLAFQMFDTDNSGEIDIQEIKDAFKGIGKVRESVWKDLIKQGDNDGNGSISFPEFKQLMLKMMTQKDQIQIFAEIL